METFGLTVEFSQVTYCITVTDANLIFFMFLDKLSIAIKIGLIR